MRLGKNRAFREQSNPLQASLADNASLLNNKAEGSLSVARAAVADSLTDAARKSLINAVLSSGKVVADDLSSELWEEIKNLGLTTRTGTATIHSAHNDPLAKIYFSTPFEHGCAAVHITNVRLPDNIAVGKPDPRSPNHNVIVSVRIANTPTEWISYKGLNEDNGVEVTYNNCFYTRGAGVYDTVRAWGHKGEAIQELCGVIFDYIAYGY